MIQLQYGDLKSDIFTRLSKSADSKVIVSLLFYNEHKKPYAYSPDLQQKTKSIDFAKLISQG